MFLVPDTVYRSIPQVATAFALLTLTLSTVACGEKSNSAKAAPSSNQPQASAPGAGGGRGPRTVVLAASDVGEVQRRSIDATIEITGTLRPIDNVVIRSRIEGQLERVYVREGQAVRAGQLLAQFEAIEQQSNAASAEANLAAAEAELSTAKWNREQAEELFKAGAIPERDYRAAQQEEKSALAKVSAAQAMLRSASLTARDTRVVAPVDGVIDTRAVESGEHVAKGATLFTLVRNTTLELAAAVPERNASALVAGQRVIISADGRTFEGKVSRISPTIDPANRTITVYVDIPNSNGALKGGSFATGSIIAKSIPNTLVVPTSALRQNAKSTQFFVYRVNGGIIQEVDVKTGVVNDRDQIAEILEGLSEGDQVVVGNLGSLSDGMKAQIIGRDSADRR
jgi:membrane fusion protein (multidrug efflux system)